MGDSYRLRKYFTMISDSRKAQKEFIKKIDQDPSVILAADLPYYYMIKSGKFTSLVFTSVVSSSFLIYWINRIKINEQNPRKLFTCIVLVGLLPFYFNKLSFGRDSQSDYEEYFYAKYVLYNSKPK
jgi:hypothetical protein